MAGAASSAPLRRLPHRRGQHGDARDVVARVDAEALAAGLLNLRLPGVEARRLFPAQLVEPRLELGFRIVAEGRDDAAGGADQRGEAAADLDVELEALRLRRGDGDDPVESDDLHAEHRDPEALGQPVEHRLGEVCEAVAAQPLAGEREDAGLQRVTLGVGIERDQLFRDQRAQHVEAGAGHQPELSGDRLERQRRVALAEQAQHRRRARDGGGLAVFQRFGEPLRHSIF